MIGSTSAAYKKEFEVSRICPAVAAVVVSDRTQGSLCMDCHKAGFVHERDSSPLLSKMVMLVSLPMLWPIDIIDTTDTEHFDISVSAKCCNMPVIINTAAYQNLPKVTASQVMEDIDLHCCLQPEVIDATEYILYNVSPKLVGIKDQGIVMTQVYVTCIGLTFTIQERASCGAGSVV